MVTVVAVVGSADAPLGPPEWGTGCPTGLELSLAINAPQYGSTAMGLPSSPFPFQSLHPQGLLRL